MTKKPEQNPITPDAALSFYIENRRYEVRESTLRTHKSRIRSFTRWLDDEGIHNMNDVDLHAVHDYRVYKRDDNGDDPPCNSVTMQGQVSTLRRFLEVLGNYGYVSPNLAENIQLPKTTDEEESRDVLIDSGRANAILDFLREYRYASPQHVTFLLMWRSGARRGGIRALDLKDFDRDEMALSFEHRPDTGTPLKNGKRGERDVGLTSSVCTVIEDYIDSPNRVRVLDDENRHPLITTEFGRPSPSTIQNWVYNLTRPCEIGEPCPHDYDPTSCEFTRYDNASGCPSSVSPHAIRRGSITAFRNAGTPREVVSDRGDVSEKILMKHYDKASKRQQMRRRRDHIPEDV